MSAFLCSEKHISTLVHELVGTEIIDESLRGSTIKALLQTNLDSLSARYPDDTAASDAEDYSYNYCPQVGLHPMEVYKLARCYEYQSCEHEGWKDSKARSLMENLKEFLIVQTPEYAKAKWSLD